MDLMNFSDVAKRLMQVLEISTETKLAAACGFSQVAWARRKMRNAVPTEAVDKLIDENGLNPEFVYYGTGNVFAPLDGTTWEQQYSERAKHLTLNAKYLISLGHLEKTIHDLAAPSKTAAKYLHVLRDLEQLGKVDLGWLIAARTNSQSDLNQEEIELINAYRKAPSTGKSFMRQAGGMVAIAPAKKVTKKRDGGSIKVGGNISSSTVQINN